ncbi:hypothetical protein [Roseibium alexandrii]|uniref:Uncharacterized protein n=1 Tax=Roseibium alexandrii TaxID=388408 RepID=A0A0M7ASA8_9HYPH|nr:hypothetical protein [Roseibium alexandrii]CTQ76683.1 hypothetical protein LAX5112_04672 [Roseibium alexandrii]
MSAGIENGDVPHHLPLFITGPGQTDILFVFVVCLVLIILLITGNFYFKLHALPEHMAHGRRSTQFQLVGILALLALFTHQNLYWVAALVLATVRLPDYLTPIESIAESLRLQRPGQSLRDNETKSTTNNSNDMSDVGDERTEGLPSNKVIEDSGSNGQET